MVRAILACFALAGIAPAAFAQADTVRFAENFGKDAQYHVDCRVKISGSLPVPASAKDPNPKPLELSGHSTIQYDERILQAATGGVAERTLRHYDKIEFHRTVNDDKQQNQLRPSVRKLVILRHKQYEVPFSPLAPLTWGEIELVRTDVFVPALAGLFPGQPQRPGQRWYANIVAIQELTDLEELTKSELVCQFESFVNIGGRRHAHVSFRGSAQGVGDDGNALHELDGSFYYDVDASFLSYLSVNGTHHLLNGKGAKVGKITGTFVMTRSRATSKELSDEANRGLTLEPNGDNTLLLFHSQAMGVRILHPRNWRIVGGSANQIGIDENRGAGMLITLTPAATTPKGTDFYQETLAYFQKQQARVTAKELPRAVQPGLETFLLEGDVGKEKLALRYYIVRQGNHGATIAVRIPVAGVAVVQPEVERMVRNLQLGVK